MVGCGASPESLQLCPLWTLSEEVLVYFETPHEPECMQKHTLTMVVNRPGSPKALYDAKGLFYDMVCHSGEMDELQRLLGGSSETASRT